MRFSLIRKDNSRSVDDDEDGDEDDDAAAFGRNESAALGPRIYQQKPKQQAAKQQKLASVELSPRLCAFNCCSSNPGNPGKLPLLTA